MTHKLVHLLVTAIATGIITATAASGEPTPFQDQEHFEAAILGRPGVGPTGAREGELFVIMSGESFVLVTIVDNRTRKHHTGCVQSWLLVWAVHLELDVELDRAQRAVLANRDHVFRFSRPAALQALIGRSKSFFGYTDAELRHARRRLAQYTREQLLEGAWEREGDPILSLSPAAACALIERGLSARRGDRPPTIEAYP
jgi:hypothetical protein